MFDPQPGDVLIRGTTAHRYNVLDAVTQKRLAGPLTLLNAAVARAHRRDRYGVSTERRPSWTTAR